MVDKEIVLETVKKMYESGIEDEVVEQTLKDIGLNKAEIGQYIAEVKGEAAPAKQSPLKPIVASQDDEDSPFHEMAVAPAPKDEAQVAMHETTHAALEEQAERTDELIGKVANIEKKLSAFSSVEQGTPQAMVAVNQRLAALEKKSGEIRAEVSAMRSILEKILETDRKVLNKL